MKVILFSFVLFVVSCTWCSTNKEEQKYIVLNVEDYLTEKKVKEWKSVKTHKVNLIAVLNYYYINVRFSDVREIMIPIEELGKKDFIKTCFDKSMDEEWLSLHIYLSSDSIRYYR